MTDNKPKGANYAALTRHRLCRKSNILFIALMLAFNSCYFTPKGGGDILNSSSIQESINKEMFVAEYRAVNPDFEYRDSLVYIRFSVKSAFIEQVHKLRRRIPPTPTPEYTKGEMLFVAECEADSVSLLTMDSLWFINHSKQTPSGKNYIVFYMSDLLRTGYDVDTIEAEIATAHAYNEKTFGNAGDIHILGNIHFVKNTENVHNNDTLLRRLVREGVEWYKEGKGYEIEIRYGNGDTVQEGDENQ